MSEKDKIYEQYKLKQCPMCGSSNLDQEPDFMQSKGGEKYSWGYDVYCNDCKWSGEIKPDLLDEVMMGVQEEEYKTIYSKAKMKMDLFNLLYFGFIFNVLSLLTAIVFNNRQFAIVLVWTFIIILVIDIIRELILGKPSKKEKAAILFIENKRKNVAITFDNS